MALNQLSRFLVPQMNSSAAVPSFAVSVAESRELLATFSCLPLQFLANPPSEGHCGKLPKRDTHVVAPMSVEQDL